MISKICCSNESCKNIILRKGADGMWRFSIKSMKTEGEGRNLIAICKSCKSEVEIPFSIQSMERSDDSSIRKGCEETRRAYDVRYDGGFAVLSRDTLEKSS